MPFYFYGGMFVENKYKIITVVLCVAAFSFGWYARAWLHICPVAEPEIKTEVKYKTDTKTEIVYVPKYIYQDGSTEKTDIDINVGKQELAVKVNGKDFGIKKADNEKYVFDKYKLQLNQTSRSDLNITVPVIDKTKRWEIGIGASKDGAVGMVEMALERLNENNVVELDEERKALVKQALSVYKTIRPDIRVSRPFWPLGLAGYSDEIVSLGLFVEGKAYLAVWKRSGAAESVTLPISDAVRTALDSEKIALSCIYPGPETAEASYDPLEKAVKVALPKPVMARLFELTPDR